ncbi:hypothetical protein MICAI_1750010 [Microcystis sp. T1-4]|nr:hypothetical protein MICAI_1750010 [Microcystis sp. T1-4]
MSGLVLEAQSKLKPYNPIYTAIFNPSWVEQERAKLRLYIEEFENWEKMGKNGKKLIIWLMIYKNVTYCTEPNVIGYSNGG